MYTITSEYKAPEDARWIVLDVDDGVTGVQTARQDVERWLAQQAWKGRIALHDAGALLEGFWAGSGDNRIDSAQTVEVVMHGHRWRLVIDVMADPPKPVPTSDAPRMGWIIEDAVYVGNYNRPQMEAAGLTATANGNDIQVTGPLDLLVDYIMDEWNGGDSDGIEDVKRMFPV